MGRHVGTAGLALAWLLAAPLTSARPQGAGEGQAVAAIKRLGGEVKRDEKSPGSPVVEVDLGATRVADEDLAHLKALPGLRRLNLPFTRVTDRGLEHLKGCSRLEVVVLFCCTDVTDKGVGHLKGLTGLRQLDLSHTRVTGRGLEHLRGLAGLRELGLCGVGISKEAEQRLRRALPKVKIEQGNGNTARKRVRKHFCIPDSAPLTRDVIRAAILAKLPAGSTEEQVYSFLKKSGIGTDKFSSFYRAREGVFCRIEFDPGSGKLAHTHYGISFQLDARKRLKDVAVEEWYTGP